MELFDRNGHRKYLNAAERERFKTAVVDAERHERIFALMLYHTGGRISEILSLRHQDIDLDNETVRIHTLKRRKQGILINKARWSLVSSILELQKNTKSMALEAFMVHLVR